MRGKIRVDDAGPGRSVVAARLAGRFRPEQGYAITSGAATRMPESVQARPYRATKVKACMEHRGRKGLRMTCRSLRAKRRDPLGTGGWPVHAGLARPPSATAARPTKMEGRGHGWHLSKSGNDQGPCRTTAHGPHFESTLNSVRRLAWCCSSVHRAHSQASTGLVSPYPLKVSRSLSTPCLIKYSTALLARFSERFRL